MRKLRIQKGKQIYTVGRQHSGRISFLCDSKFSVFIQPCLPFSCDCKSYSTCMMMLFLLIHSEKCGILMSTYYMPGIALGTLETKGKLYTLGGRGVGDNK